MFDRNEELRTALHESVADLTATPDAMLPALRKRYARRVAARRVGMIATPVVVAAAVVGSVALAPRSGPAGGTTTAAAPVQDVSYVTARAVKALDDAGRDITYVKWAPPAKAGHSETSEIWVRADGSAVRKRLTHDGTVLGDEEFTKTEIFVVDHTSKHYYHSPNSGTGATLPDGRSTVGFPLPSQIKQALRGGGLTIAGNEVINGKPTIHLKGTGTVPGFVGDVPFNDLWVSKSSYLPVRIGWGTDHRSQDFTWLPPTPQNQALLTPPIPAGYTEIPGK